MLEANFWQDKHNAQKIVKEKKLQEDLIESYNYLVKECRETSQDCDGEQLGDLDKRNFRNCFWWESSKSRRQGQQRLAGISLERCFDKQQTPWSRRIRGVQMQSPQRTRCSPISLLFSRTLCYNARNNDSKVDFHSNTFFFISNAFAFK